jgi:sec-independent protein translocase protein TatB
VFGLGFWEMLVIVIVGVVVLGPRRLPEMMRTAGQWVSKLRRLSTQLRAESGIDELIRNEGLERDIHELRSLARVNVLDTLTSAATSATGLGAAGAAASVAPSSAPAPRLVASGVEPLREREYPPMGCDASGVEPDDFELEAAVGAAPDEASPRAEAEASPEAEPDEQAPASGPVPARSPSERAREAAGGDA